MELMCDGARRTALFVMVIATSASCILKTTGLLADRQSVQY